MRSTAILFLSLAICLVICAGDAVAGDVDDHTTKLSEILPGRAWPERRKEIERRWLDLLGDFPQDAPASREFGGR